jgi:hypothetical protein
MAKEPKVKQDDQETTPPVVTGQDTSALPPVPTIGRIVRYCLSEQDADVINADRKKSMAEARAKTSDKSRSPAREGSAVKAGDFVAMIIVAVWGDTCVNGKIFLDGNDSHWVTSRNLGENSGPGFWNWPR